MITSGDLVRIIAAALDLGPETVGVHLRNIRLARLIAMKGFGRGAAPMGPFDAARLLLAAVGSAFAKESVLSVESYGQLKPFSETSTKAEDPHDRLRHFPNLETGLGWELRRLRAAPWEDLPSVYRDEWDAPNDLEQLGAPALQLLTCASPSGPLRAAVLRQFFPNATETFSFSALGRKVDDERQFYVAAHGPATITVRCISPRALARIARQL